MFKLIILSKDKTKENEFTIVQIGILGFTLCKINVKYALVKDKK